MKSVKNFRIFKIIGGPRNRGPVGHSIEKNYKNTPDKKMHYKNTYALRCNVVSNIKDSANNFRRFMILGIPGGPRAI